jgi:hypothetical protein
MDSDLQYDIHARDAEEFAAKAKSSTTQGSTSRVPRSAASKSHGDYPRQPRPPPRRTSTWQRPTSHTRGDHLDDEYDDAPAERRLEKHYRGQPEAYLMLFWRPATLYDYHMLAQQLGESLIYPGTSPYIIDPVALRFMMSTSAKNPYYNPSHSFKGIRIERAANAMSAVTSHRIIITFYYDSHDGTWGAVTKGPTGGDIYMDLGPALSHTHDIVVVREPTEKHQYYALMRVLWTSAEPWRFWDAQRAPMQVVGRRVSVTFDESTTHAPAAERDLEDGFPTQTVDPMSQDTVDIEELTDNGTEEESDETETGTTAITPQIAGQPVGPVTGIGADREIVISGGTQAEGQAAGKPTTPSSHTVISATTHATVTNPGTSRPHVPPPRASTQDDPTTPPSRIPDSSNTAATHTTPSPVAGQPEDYSETPRQTLERLCVRLDRGNVILPSEPPPRDHEDTIRRIGGDMRTVAETVAAMTFHWLQLWPVREITGDGPPLDAMFMTGADYVAGWRLLGAWLLDFGDLDVLIKTTVIG